jgi:taurine dioxygenase
MTITQADFRIVSLAGSLGARVDGVDLSQDLDDQTTARLRAAWLEHLVLVFPRQQLTPAEQIAFARRWGVLAPVVGPSVKDHPEVGEITGHGVGRTDTWHSDVTFAEQPPMASLLLARSLPPAGGDTMFANQYLAYEILSPGMKRMLDGLRAIHTGAESARLLGGDVAAAPQFSHPVVRTHPETNRRALYVNRVFTSHFEDWTVDESAPLLEWLCTRCSQPNLTFRHTWSEGDLVMWDNRCAQHFAVWDYGDARRVMHRITVVGDRPA